MTSQYGTKIYATYRWGALLLKGIRKNKMRRAQKTKRTKCTQNYTINYTGQAIVFVDFS